MSESVGGFHHMVPIEAAKAFVSRQISRALSDGNLKFLLGLLVFSQLEQRLAKQGVKGGLKIQQAQRAGRGSQGLLEIAGGEMKPGELEMFAGYGQLDEFNVDAQVESFAYMARGRGLTVHTVCVPRGRHDTRTGLALLPDFVQWIRPKLEPYSPK